MNLDSFATATWALTDSFLVRYLKALAVLCAVVTLALVGLFALGRWIDRWAEKGIEGHVQAALADDEPDWLVEALLLANSAAFEAAVLADIDALPTTKETA